MSELRTLEYRVKEKTVWFVTRYCEVGDGASVTEEGQFADPLSAQRAAVALCKSDHCRDGVADDDRRIIWPDPIKYNTKGPLPA